LICCITVECYSKLWLWCHRILFKSLLYLYKGSCLVTHWNGFLIWISLF